MKITAFILTAGNGKRLRPLTADTPKPMLQMNGKPVLAYIVENLKKHMITNIAVNVCYKPEKILRFAAEHKLKVYPETRLRGTAGALIQAKEWLTDPFLVVNGDTLSTVNYTDMVDWHMKSQALVTIFTKHDEIHSGGSYIFNKEVFQYIPKNRPYSIHESLIPDLIEKIPERIRLYQGDNASYLDIGTMAGFMKAGREYQKYE